MVTGVFAALPTEIVLFDISPHGSSPCVIMGRAKAFKKSKLLKKIRLPIIKKVLLG
jgi:hypothetical protein